MATTLVRMKFRRDVTGIVIKPPERFGRVERHVALRLGIDGVVRDRLRWNVLEPMRRLGRDGDDVALGQVMHLSAFHIGGALLTGRGVLGSDQCPTRHERRFTLDDDEDVVGVLVNFDFTGDQYFSWIRSHGVLVRGPRGEIHDGAIRYLESFDKPVRLELLRQDAGETGNLEGLWHKGYLAGAEWVFRNPYPGAPLSDDEIAVATLLTGMQAHVEGGKDIYSFAEAAQDQLLALTIDEAVKTGTPVTTARQPWVR